MRTIISSLWVRGAGLVALMLLGPVVAVGAEAEKSSGAARCVSDEILLLRREAADQPWRVVSVDETLRPGELLVGGAGAALLSGNGAVRLSFLGQLAGTSPYPVRETAVVLHENKDVDLDVTLDRGRIDLVNRKEKGSARVRVRIRNRAAEIVLAGPGARLAVEIYGRWLPGVPFRKKPRPGEAPALAVLAVALAGEVEIRGKEKHCFLTGPPGPALLHADNLDDPDVAPIHLKKLPDWATGEETERTRKIKALATGFRKTAREKSVGAAIDELLHSDDPLARQGAVTLMGATDDLRRLGEALVGAKHADVWDNGVLVLRHWIGRGPGQDQKLYKALTEGARMPASQAETVMDLLHGFSEDDLTHPITYQALLVLLESDRLAIRGLAHWHLTRLAPEGREFGYDPLAPKEQRQVALKKWQKLIPPGKVPASGWTGGK
jgi:hypothetical protein